MKRAQHPSGTILTFDEAAHVYSDEVGSYISTTTLIKSYFAPFDLEGIASKKAKALKVPVEELIADWKRRGDEASSFGNRFHLMAEKIVSTNDSKAADEMAETEKDIKYLKCLKSAFERMFEKYIPVACEKIVFSPKMRISGTIDLLLRDKKTGGLVVADYKTSKVIHDKAFGQKKGFGPCSKLPDCNLAHYSLQLEIYKRLLLDEGFMPNDQHAVGAIIHFKTDEAGNVSVNQFNPIDVAGPVSDILSSRKKVS